MVPLSARRADDPESLPPAASSGGQMPPEMVELISLTAQSFPSRELMLDLVLYDLADQARRAVGASGAAIALERNGELVYRAAAGSTAPDLGVRIHTESGMSGICLKQGTTQLCRDTEADDRVDAEACRHLGVRSIVLIPLFSSERIIGIFEVLSARTNAFPPEAFEKLESLATDAAQNVKAAREPTGDDANSDDSAVLSVNSVMKKVTPTDPAVRVLRWLVIGLAIPLIVLIGFDWRWHRAQAPLRTATFSHDEETRQAKPPTESPHPVTAPNAPTSHPAGGSHPTPKVPNAPASRGGLVIYQKGRVIYREGPGAGGEQPSSRTNTGLTKPGAARSAAESDSNKN